MRLPLPNRTSMDFIDQGDSSIGDFAKEGKKSQSSFLRKTPDKALTFIKVSRVIEPNSAKSLKGISSRFISGKQDFSGVKEVLKESGMKTLAKKGSLGSLGKGNHVHNRSLGERLVTESIGSRSNRGANEGAFTARDEYQLVQKNTPRFIKGKLPNIMRKGKNDDVYMKSNRSSYLMIKRLKESF